MQSTFVSKKKAARMLGVNQKIIENWMFRHWKRGLHYVVIGRTTMINLTELEKWMFEMGEIKNSGNSVSKF